jgi:hypothetical protein
MKFILDNKNNLVDLNVYMVRLKSYEMFKVKIRKIMEKRIKKLLISKEYKYIELE